MAKKTRRRTAFVPRLILRTAIAGVIPACALLGCSSSDSSPSGSDDTGIFNGVADAGYGDTRFGVADTSYRDVPAVADAAYGDTNDANDSHFSVADTAYPDTRPADASDAPGEVDDGGAPDVFGVAAVAYPAYESGVPG
jgi:hypothetical protein